jgi:hypothetical protein
MRTLILGLMFGAAVIAVAPPSHAIYTECTMQKDIEAVDRPGGNETLFSSHVTDSTPSGARA